MINIGLINWQSLDVIATLTFYSPELHQQTVCLYHAESLSIPELAGGLAIAEADWLTGSQQMANERLKSTLIALAKAYAASNHPEIT